MTIVPAKQIIESAKKHKYGQAAFNINTLDQLKTLIKIHEALRSPLIIQVAEPALGFIGGNHNFLESTIADKEKGAQIIGEALRKYGSDVDIPIALHLDHGKNFDTIKAVIEHGFTSVMYDGSDLPYEENVANTAEVVNYAHSKGVTVEAELGVLAGVEDNIFSESSTYTNPVQALDFVKRTKVDMLAVSYGTKHGPNKGSEVKLRTEIVNAIAELLNFENIDCGIVSHGSSTIPSYIVSDLNEFGVDITGMSGIAVPEIQHAIQLGINKINIDTDIRLATIRNLYDLTKSSFVTSDDRYNALMDQLKNNRNILDPRAILEPYMEEVMYGLNTKNIEEKRLKIAFDKAIIEIASQIVTDFNSLGQMDRVSIKQPVY